MKTFDFQVSLSDSEFAIRPLTESDFLPLYDVAKDKKIWVGHPAKNRYKKPEFLVWFNEAIRSKACLVFIDSHKKRIIGSSRFYQTRYHPDDIAIGYTFLSRTYWGGETNRALKKLMLAHASSHFDTIWFHIAPTNSRSQKSIEKIGAVLADKRLANISGAQEEWLFYRLSGKALRALIAN